MSSFNPSSFIWSAGFSRISKEEEIKKKLIKEIKIRIPAIKLERFEVNG